MVSNDARLQLLLQLRDEASRGLTTFGTRVQRVSDRLRSMRLPLLAVTGAIAGLAVASVKAASDLEESINAVEVVFGRGSSVIQEFGETAATSVGLARSEFNQLSAVTGALLQDVGLPMQEVAELTNQLSVRAADMASVFNTSVQDALGAVNQALRGETEGIRRFTGDVTEASLEQFRLAENMSKHRVR